MAAFLGDVVDGVKDVGFGEGWVAHADQVADSVVNVVAGAFAVGAADDAVLHVVAVAGALAFAVCDLGYQACAVVDGAGGFTQGVGAAGDSSIAVVAVALQGDACYIDNGT